MKCKIIIYPLAETLLLFLNPMNSLFFLMQFGMNETHPTPKCLNVVVPLYMEYIYIYIHSPKRLLETPY